MNIIGDKEDTIKTCLCSFNAKRFLGQSTIEFALVCFAFISVIVALGVLWHLFEKGLFVEHALASASHHLQSVFSGVVGDVLLF